MESRREHRQILYLCVFITLLVIGGTGGYWAGDVRDADTPDTGEVSEQRSVRININAPYFYTFPEMTAPLKAGRCRAPRVRFAMAVQVSEHLEGLLNERSDTVQEAVMRQAQSYQRKDLTGPEGADRMRADAESVINKIIAPARVQKVLFNKMTLN